MILDIIHQGFALALIILKTSDLSILSLGFHCDNNCILRL